MTLESELNKKGLLSHYLNGWPMSRRQKMQVFYIKKKLIKKAKTK